MKKVRFYYLDADGQTVLGPYSKSELKSIWASSNLPGSTLCVREGAEDWQPFDQMVREERRPPCSYYYLDADGQTVHGPYSAREMKSVWMSLDLACSTLCVREASEDWQPFKRMVNELYCDWSDWPSRTDIEDDSKLQLMLKTKVRQEGERRYIIEQNTPSARESWPCWELVRVGVKPSDQMRDWPSRWLIAGGVLYAGRMIAPKDSEIWARLGSSELFDDALDTEFPPYALDSHMVRFARPRALCIELGVIHEDFVPKAPKGSPISQASQALTTSFSREFLEDLRRDLKAKVDGLQVKIDGDKIKLAKGGVAGAPE